LRHYFPVPVVIDLSTGGFMKRFRLALLISAAIMITQAGVTVNSGQGNTTLKSPHTKTDKQFGDEEKQAKEEAKEKKEKAEDDAVKRAAGNGSAISTEDLYNRSKHGGGTKYNVDPAQQH
jgi:hypothetical protein